MEPYDILNRHRLFVRGDERALNQELVPTLGGQWRLFFHSLEHHCAFVVSSRRAGKMWRGLSPTISTVSPGSIRPEFGRTQYSCATRDRQNASDFSENANIAHSWGRCLDLECDGLTICIVDTQCPFHELRQRP